MFRKIVCPVDYSVESKYALQAAARMAIDAEAELVLVHVWNVPAQPSTKFPVPVDAVELVTREQERELALISREVTRLGVKRVTTKLPNGVPWEQIVHAAEGADLVVTGTHGRTGIARVLLGSVAEKVARHAPCSVLAARPRGDAKAFDHVLCPIDFSDSSRQAIELAVQVAAPRGAGITLFHAIEVPAVYYEQSLPHRFEDTEAQTTRLIEQWAAELAAKVSVPVTTVVQTGSAGARIIGALDDDATFDLVVIGSHGHTGLHRVLLGSIAETVMRHAPCSVLVARAHASSAALRSPV